MRNSARALWRGLVWLCTGGWERDIYQAGYDAGQRVGYSEGLANGHWNGMQEAEQAHRERAIDEIIRLAGGRP